MVIRIAASRNAPRFLRFVGFRVDGRGVRGLGRLLGGVVAGVRGFGHRIRVASTTLTAARLAFQGSGLVGRRSQRFSLIFAFLPRSSRR